MPKFLALTPQQAAEVAQFGAEPSEYVFDADTGEAVPKAEVPTTWSEELGAGLKSILPGVADAVLSPLSLAGQTADLIRQGVGTYDPKDPSGFTQLAKSAKEGIVDLVGEPDPRASWLSTGVGRGLGNLAGIATPAALGRKLTGVAANRLAGGIGGAMMGESAIEREMAQQAEAGVQDPVKAAAKGLVSGLGGGYLESKLGAGSILRNLAKPSGTLGGRLGRGLFEAGKGGITEGLQQGLENVLVTEGDLQLGDPNFDPGRAALIGGLVQGPASVALDTLAGKPETQAEAAAPAGEAPKTGLSGLKTGRVKPTATPEDTQGAPTYSPTPGVAEAMLKAGKEWNPPIKTPVDSAFKKLADQNVIVTPEDIHSLYNTWSGKAENAKAVEAAANDIYARNVMNDVQKPKSALDVINAELAVRGKYNETRGNLQAELAKLDKKDADLQKTIAENPAAMGTITVANAELARNAAQRKVYEGLLSELDNQEMLELSANQPKLPTKGMAIPATGVSVGAGEVALPRTGRPSVEVSDNSVAITPAPPGPTKPKVAPRGTADPAVQETLQGYAQDAGTLGLSVPMDPARAKTLQEMREQQEGEQGSPFGESPQVRYSGIPWKEFMQLARQGRSGLHALRPRYSGYKPASPIDAANNLDLFKEGSAVQDVVYHVTTAPMGIKNDIFDVGANKDELGAHFGTLDTIGELKRRHKKVINQEDAQVYPVHLNIQNPVILPDIFPLSDWARDIQTAKANLDAAGTPIDAQNLVIDWLQRKAEGTVESTQDLRIGLQKLGYDGARYVNAAEGGGDSWIVFNPRQVKSATGNVGTFDEKNPSIMYSGFNIQPMLEAGKEALRRGRRWLTPDQVQDGTYMLSGVAGLNNERPWGMQVAGDGKLPVSGLVPKMAANIPKGEMEAYKAAGLEKWLEGKGKVGREELQAWMMENGPVVEVKELRPQTVGPLQAAYATGLHNMENLGYTFGNDTLSNSAGYAFSLDFDSGDLLVRSEAGQKRYKATEVPPDFQNKYDFLQLARKINHSPSQASSPDSTIGQYGVEPRPVEEMEGPVELLVRVPIPPVALEDAFAPKRIRYLSESDKPAQGVLWPGRRGHHGESGNNTLGFGRANVETLPDGRKVLHVFEAQSDWGQRVRKEQEEGRSDTPSHPLLDESNRLILKAAIKYALDNNLDGIAISDAETAMITEGHDAAGSMVRRVSPQEIIDEANAFATLGFDEDVAKEMYGNDWRNGTYVQVNQEGNRRTVRIDKPEANRRNKELARELTAAGYGQKEGAYIPQEGGMRLNYDQKLPKIAKELTGFDGERVSFGEHWKARKIGALFADSVPEDMLGDYPEELYDRVPHGPQPGRYNIYDKKLPRENLIFKNPDGSPKTDITARVYPLDKARKMFEDQTAFTLFGRDQSYYSGLPVPQLKFIDDLFKSLGLKNLGSPDPLYHLGKSVTSRMATRGPSGGLVKWLFADMTREKQQIANVLMEATEPFREFVNTENGIKWINRASTDETWDDFSGLSEKEIPAAQAYAQFWSDLRDLITDRGVYVMEVDPATGKVTPRPGQKLPGYTPWSIGDHIYEMAGDKNREAEWKQAQEDFVEKWKEKFGENSENMAREAIANILGVKGMETGPGGEPLFGPVSLPHGMTLPESWRDKRPADSLNRYIRRVSQHLAWAEKVQYNPAARRVFNIKADPMGNDTSKTDPTTWAEAPEAWAYAVREGKRVRADWALRADENNPPDEPIDFAGDSANMNALLSSFKQASSPNPNLQAFSSAASAALMQAPTGLRDVGMSLVRAAQYAGPSAALRASMDYIANIPAKLAEARRAGAMPSDLLEPEIVANSKAIARGMMKAARKMRAWSGREFLDNTGRVIIYDAVKSVILEGNGDHLVKEFGPAYTEGMSKEEIADQTAAVLSHRASNVSDAGSLPAGMLPQGGGLSAPLSLVRWSVAQYNTFAEDVVNPMLDGKGELGMKRFLTLVLGSIVGGSVINGLLDDLLKRKPDHLTWGEWLNVFNDPKVDKATKAKEFAYAAASRAQVMGALGWVGDYLVAPATREIAGGTRWANQTDIQYPAWIVGNQMAQTIGSYYNAVVNKRTDGRDFLDFLLELGKINQNVRVAHGAIKNMQGEEKKGLRDQGVVERVYGLNSSTGREAGLQTGMGPVFRSDPFNFTRQAMGSEDLGKLEGFLESRRKTGQVPALDEWSQDRRYYQALERLVGEEEAKKRREVDRKMDQEVRKKNREIRRLSR